ncbi:sulfatase domain-containing protein [Sarocladium implicatum]|nr:sulfatase domain-containing protein [Sarocladium implicatum]
MRMLGSALLFGFLPAVLASGTGESRRPNFVFILTDDQDTHMNSLDYMPRLDKHLTQKGTSYSKHYCTVAICCPSRVNLWTGQMAHNTNVTDVSPPYGGYPKFVANGYNDNHLALWMQQSGYNTYYSGKLFNSHTVDNYNDPLVKGYTGSDFLLDPFTYQYWNATSTRNGQTPVNHAGKYSPDLTAQSAYEFLAEAMSDDDTPFFLTVAPVAPHADVTLYPEIIASPPKVAPRHKHLFNDYKIPRTANFNPEDPSGVSWVSKLPRLNDTVLEYNDEYQRDRLRSLQAVDEMVEKIVKMLEDAQKIEDTYIIYTTDNGYHISQHRMHPSKECGFETDINVPLIIRGPGVKAGGLQKLPSSHTDIAPTIMHLAGNSLEYHQFDGTPISVTGEDSEVQRQEHVAVEFWGLGVPEGRYGYSGKYQFVNGTANAYVNNTYKGLRIESQEYSLYYSVWCTNEREVYDMKNDPGQINNILADQSSSTTINGFSLKAIVSRLDALMMVLKSCKGETCIRPWDSLHPDGAVNSLTEALHDQFDAFYTTQPKVSFTSCELGYLVEAEGPQAVFPFPTQLADGATGEQKPLFAQDWSIWV